MLFCDMCCAVMLQKFKIVANCLLLFYDIIMT